LANQSKKQLDADVVDKLWQNLNETGRIVRRLFVTFFTLMLVISALTFDPDIFTDKRRASQKELLATQQARSQEADSTRVRPNDPVTASEPSVPFFGVRLFRGGILKYGSLFLAAIYLMLITYLIYLDQLRTEFIETYTALFAGAGVNDDSLIAKIRIPSFHYIIGDLAEDHPSKLVNWAYQSLNVIKSFVLYVLPMVLVIKVLGIGLQSATSPILKGLLYLSPVLVITATIAITREWFVETGNFLHGLVKTTTVATAVWSVNQFKASAAYLSSEKAKSLISERDFYDSLWNAEGSGIENKFELRVVDGDSVVHDTATGLTWQQSGSNPMTFAAAQEYIQKLNAEEYAGYGDWRLPTLAEAMTLMESQKSAAGLYIDPVFDKTQRWIWTADKWSASFAWVVDFYNGFCDYVHVGDYSFVRAVR